MKIHRVEIAGFGKLRDLNLELAPRINLFFGENEAGKSTLQRAFLALLYGFYEGNRATKVENEDREIWCPWKEASYGGALEYELDDGRHFRIQRDFKTDDVPTKVLDLSTGRDVTSDFGIGRHGNVPVVKQQLGMPRSIFVSSAFISQGAIKQLEETQRIGDVIANLADTGKRDISAVKAVGNLDKVIRQEVGTERSRTTPLAIARRKLSETREELQEYKRAKEAVESAASEKEKLSEALLQTKMKLQRIDLCIISKQLDDVEDRISRIEKQDRRITQAKLQLGKLQEYADFPR